MRTPIYLALVVLTGCSARTVTGPDLYRVGPDCTLVTRQPPRYELQERYAEVCPAKATATTWTDEKGLVWNVTWTYHPS